VTEMRVAVCAMVVCVGVVVRGRARRGIRRMNALAHVELILRGFAVVTQGETEKN
jgi:hypothetical protein